MKCSNLSVTMQRLSFTFREPFAARWITGFGKMPSPAGGTPTLPVNPSLLICQSVTMQ